MERRAVAADAAERDLVPRERVLDSEVDVQVNVLAQVESTLQTLAERGDGLWSSHLEFEPLAHAVHLNAQRHFLGCGASRALGGRMAPIRQRLGTDATLGLLRCAAVSELPMPEARIVREHRLAAAVLAEGARRRALVADPAVVGLVRPGRGGRRGRGGRGGEGTAVFGTSGEGRIGARVARVVVVCVGRCHLAEKLSNPRAKRKAAWKRDVRGPAVRHLVRVDVVRSEPRDRSRKGVLAKLLKRGRRRLARWRGRALRPRSRPPTKKRPRSAGRPLGDRLRRRSPGERRRPGVACRDEGGVAPCPHERCLRCAVDSGAAGCVAAVIGHLDTLDRSPAPDLPFTSSLLSRRVSCRITESNAPGISSPHARGKSTMPHSTCQFFGHFFCVRVQYVDWGEGT